jgi:hypothetical protein
MLRWQEDKYSCLTLQKDNNGATHSLQIKNNCAKLHPTKLKKNLE